MFARKLAEYVPFAYSDRTGSFCARYIAIREQLGRHPAAKRILRNMLRYAARETNLPPVELPADFPEQLSRMGYTPWHATVDYTGGGQCDLLVRSDVRTPQETPTNWPRTAVATFFHQSEHLVKHEHPALLSCPSLLIGCHLLYWKRVRRYVVGSIASIAGGCEFNKGTTGDYKC